RVEVGGTGAHDDLEVFARIEGAARLEQHAPQFVPQVMKRGSQGKRLLVLPDRLRQAAGPEVRIAQGSVLVGQFGGDMGSEALAWLAPDLGGAPARGVRLGLPSQLVQHDGAVHQRLDVMGVERQGTVELREGLILLAHEDRKSTRLNSSHQIISYA